MAPMANDVLEAQDDLDRWKETVQEHEACFQAWLVAPAGQGGKDWIGRELQRLAEKSRDLELAIRERLALLQVDQVASVDTRVEPGDDLPDPWQGEPVSMDLS